MGVAMKVHLLDLFSPVSCQECYWPPAAAAMGSTTEQEPRLASSQWLGAARKLQPRHVCLMHDSSTSNLCWKPSLSCNCTVICGYSYPILLPSASLWSDITTTLWFFLAWFFSCSLSTFHRYCLQYLLWMVVILTPSWNQLPEWLNWCLYLQQAWILLLLWMTFVFSGIIVCTDLCLASHSMIVLRFIHVVEVISSPFHFCC